MRELLDKKQRRDFDRNGAFNVLAKSGDLYRVTDEGWMGNVQVVPKGKRKPTHRLCAHPVGVPQSDIMLTQKLMIETDEERFREIAKRHPLH